MNKLISLLMAGVFFVTSTITFSNYFSSQYLNNNRTFESYSAAFDFYYGVSCDSQYSTSDRIRALYICTDIYVDHISDLSSSQKSNIQIICDVDAPGSLLRTFVTYLLAKAGALASDLNASDFSFTTLKNMYHYSDFDNDVEFMHYLYEMTGMYTSGEPSESFLSDFKEAVQNQNPYKYWYTPSGYYRILSQLRVNNYNIPSSVYDEFKVIFDDIKENHPLAIFWVYPMTNHYVYGNYWEFYWVDLADSYVVATHAGSANGYEDNVNIYDLSFDRKAYSSELGNCGYYLLTENEGLIDVGVSLEDNISNLNRFGNHTMYHYLYLSYTDDISLGAGALYYNFLNPEGFSRQCLFFSFDASRHVAFETISDLNEWSLGFNSVYMTLESIADTLDNFNPSNYYNTYNYISESVEGLTPEELQSVIDGLVREINELGSDVVNQNKETNKLLQKIYDKLEAILDQMDDKREDSTSNGGIWIGDLLYFILYLLYAILILADFLSLAASCFDWFNHLWAISASPGIVAGNEWFIGAHNILNGGVAFGLEEPIVIFGFLTLHDFMVLIFQFAFWAVVISTAKKKATELNIPEIGRRR